MENVNKQQNKTKQRPSKRSRSIFFLHFKEKLTGYQEDLIKCLRDLEAEKNSLEKKILSLTEKENEFKVLLTTRSDSHGASV